jgi:signal peptidase I
MARDSTIRPKIWLIVLMSASGIFLTVMAFLPRRLPAPIAITSWIMFGVSLICVLAYRIQIRRTQRRLNDEIARSPLNERERVVLYLRPFATSGRLNVNNRIHRIFDRWIIGTWIDAELALGYALEGQFTLIALGHDPRGFGAAKLSVDDVDWFDHMKRLAEQADIIVLVPLCRPSTMAEARFLASRSDLIAKTLVLMPPMRKGWIYRLVGRGRTTRRMWDAGRRDLETCLQLPGYARRGGWFRFSPDGQLLQALPCNDLEPRTIISIFEKLLVASPKATLKAPDAAFRLIDPPADTRTKFAWFDFDPVRLLLYTTIPTFALRGFILEPYKVPSGSMLPTVAPGDLIVVSKSSYGIRSPSGLPSRIAGSATPSRGDIIVFAHPQDPDADFLKRVIGVPGDKISYTSQRLYINGRIVPTEFGGNYFDEDGRVYRPLFREKLNDRGHRILVQLGEEPTYRMDRAESSFPFREQCAYDIDGIVCDVPRGHYFVLGDNRDNSRDSRYWGFVPDDYVKGRAFAIWMNFSRPDRIGYLD